jgi:serine/threonine protein kinase/tetratricopeptide (TPR) repeat protein
MENHKAQGILDLDNQKPESSAEEIQQPDQPEHAEQNGLEAITALQDIQIRRLEDLASWSVFSQKMAFGAADQVKVLEEIHRSDPLIAHRLAQATIAMPEVGTEFLGFQLIQEVGKGAFARVYLAHQGDLADRLVIVKVSPILDDESQTLAQLQHTNIVPIYSIHRADALQAVCMPFFGLTTLAHILREIKGSDSLPESGKSLVSTLVNRNSTARHRKEWENGRGTETAIKDAGASSVSPVRNGSTAILEKLKTLSYVEAVLWMAARLADGLAHAHERGILHRDLKPANILVTDEGQPMVLDFNLAHDTKTRSRASVALLGGTLPFMAPEQLAAYRHETIAENCNSDIYSLGVILYNLLCGGHPFPVRSGPLPDVLSQMIEDRQRVPVGARHWNRAVSPAVENILRHCLESNPIRRYQTARELQEDLERHLTHRALKHVADRSPAERLRKWTRRHPRLASSTSVAALALFAILGLTSLFFARSHRLAQLEADKTHRLFQQDMKTVEFLLTAFPTEPDKLQQGLDLGESALARYQVLENPAWQQLSAVKKLSAEDQGELRENLGELFFLLAQAKLSQAKTSKDSQQRQQQAETALEWNLAAEKCYAPDQVSRTLTWQRSELEDVLGHQDEAKRLRDRASQLPSRTATDHYLQATGYVSQGRYREASDLFEKVTRERPANFWAWFMLGFCHDSLARYEAAASCYGTSIALRSEFPWSYYNRGLTELRQGKYAQARTDFDEALQRRPDMPEALVNRALAKQGLGLYSEAIEDLTQALELQAPATQVYSLRSQLRLKAGDRDGAQRDLAECLRLTPTNDIGWLARGYARMAGDPKGALADFDEALKHNPRLLAGLQNKAHLLGRMGQNEDALRVLNQAVKWFPDYVPARAGRGVYHARLSHRDLAHGDAEESLLRDKSPSNVYQLAGIYALTSRTHPDDRKEALRLLSMALVKDVGLLNLLDIDKDLDPIRQDKEFIQLVNKTKALRASLNELSRIHQ